MRCALRLALWAAAGAAAAQEPPADAVCQLCHDARTAASAAAEAGRAAAHGGVRCVDCHAALQSFDPKALEHDAPLPPASCLPCHAEAAGAQEQSVHAAGKAGCAACHGGHGIGTAPAAAAAQQCGSCHAGAAAEWERGVHGGDPGNGAPAATCADCHGSHDARAPGDAEAPTSRRNVPYTCGACHAGILVDYLEGVHGKDFLKGVRDVPVCTDCHGEHTIADPALEGSSVSAALVAKTCARCHADDALAGAYGLPSGRIRSYGRSYHGIASGYGEREAANCASCHGFHDIYPGSDPRSKIHPDRLGDTCGTCHPGAGAAFARVPVHSEVTRESSPVAWTVRELYLVLIAAVIGAFLFFIVADLLGRARLRLGVGPPEPDPIPEGYREEEDFLVGRDESFPRWTLHGRLQHALLVASFLLLVLTGLPLLLHEIPGVRLLVDFEGGFRLRTDLHRAGAVGLIALSIWHLASVALHPRGRQWLRSILIRPRDVTDFLRELLFDLGVGPWLARRGRLRSFFARRPEWRGDARPLLGRYGLVEKLEYASVVWGNTVMIGSGVVLWRPDWFLDVLPPWVFELCRVVHGYEATLAFLAIIIWHMYHVHLRPGVFPMSKVWLTGRVSRAELRHHHTLEYLRLLDERRAALRASRGPRGIP